MGLLCIYICIRTCGSRMYVGTSVTQKDIRAKYMRSITFYLDVMAILPLEIFASAFSNPWEFVPALKLNRVLKLWKVNTTYIYTVHMYITLALF